MTLDEEVIILLTPRIEPFSALDDPRCPSKVEYRRIDILMMAVGAVIAGADSWEDIARYGRSQLGGLQQFLALPNGLPSHDTFWRVVMRIDPDDFERCLRGWVRLPNRPPWVRQRW